VDESKFKGNMPGRLVKISRPSGSDWAFVPDLLPRDWRLPAQLDALRVLAREQLARLDGIGQTLPNPQLLLRPLQTIEAAASVTIEGTYVTAQQLLWYELEAKKSGGGDADSQEAYNYARALIRGCQMSQELPFCNRVFCEMHRILLDDVRGHEKRPGEFRRIQVQVGSNARFIPPPPSEIAPLMQNLEVFCNTAPALDGVDPLIRCILAHYQFETIHPFEDGNGRAGRLLFSLMVYRLLNLTMPWLYMSAYFERHKAEYYESLFAVSAERDWTKWVEYCLNGVVAQATDSIMRCHVFKYIRDDFHQKMAGHATPRSHLIIEKLFEHPIVTIAGLQRELEVSYKTAKTDVERLVAAGILRPMENTYPAAFAATMIMATAYGPPMDEQKAKREAANDDVAKSSADEREGQPHE